MPILTISRELGSEGWKIGEMVADKLGYHFIDKKGMEVIFRNYGFAPFEDMYDSARGFWDRFDALKKLTMSNLNNVIKAIARHGNSVIIGRGGFALLQNYADVLNVRIHAPLDVRIKRIMEQEKITDIDKARDYLNDGTKERKSFVESHYHVPWGGMENFDMVIDTGKFEAFEAAKILCEALKSLEEKNYQGLLTTKTIIVEPFLEKVISGALACIADH